MHRLQLHLRPASALDCLAVEVSEFMPILQQIHVTSTCCSLSFIFIGGTGVLELVQPFVFIAERPTIAQFDAEPVGRFLPQLLRREKWAKHFLVFPQFALQVTLIDGEF